MSPSTELSGLRVAQVTSSLSAPLGGAEQYCISISAWLAANGAEVHLYGAGASNELVDELAGLGITVHELRHRRPYAPGQRGSGWKKIGFHAADLAESVLPSAQDVRRLAAHDVVHVHRWTGLGARVLAPGGVPTVHTVHDFSIVDTATTTVRDDRPLDRLPLAQRARARVLQRAVRDLDVAVFPTRRTLDRHLALGSTMGRRRVVIPHGWSLPAPSPRSEEVEDRPFTVTFMGKLIPDKGLPDLLDAWGDGIPGAQLVIAGAGSLERDVERRARTGAIVFRGWLGKQAQAELLRRTDVLALVSRWPENFPLVVAESLLSGVPVLATTVSAPEMLEHGRNAHVVPPTPAALREAIEHLAADPALLQHLKDGAVSSAAALDMDAHGAAVVDEYRRAIRTRANRSPR